MKKTWYAVPIGEILKYLDSHKHLLHLTNEQLHEVFNDIQQLAVEITEESED